MTTPNAPHISASAPSAEPDLPEQLRVRRATPSRQGPDRKPGNVFRSPSANQPPPLETSTTVDAARAAVEGAVGTAYRVYKEYVDWGEQAAAQLSRFRDWGASMIPNQPDMTQAAKQWAQMWQDMLRMWLSFATPFGFNNNNNNNSSNNGSWPFGSMPPFGGFWGAGPASPAPGTAQSADITFEVETSQRTSVSVSLVSPASGGTLKARLHRDGGNDAFAVEFQASSPSIKVPEAQAPGTYRGVVLDGAGNHRGTLRITISPRSA
jgi:hypothetical protein